jgi:hypothetical protein
VRAGATTLVLCGGNNGTRISKKNTVRDTVRNQPTALCYANSALNDTD